MNPPVDPRVVALLRRVASALQGIRYVIGGGVAVVAHGYLRHTSDVDVFALEGARPRVLAALRKAGLKIVPIMDPSMYAAWPPDATPDDIEVHVDILFTPIELEMWAVRHPARLTLWGADVPVMRPVVLAAIKFLTGEERHLADVRRMLDLGIVEAGKVERMIAAESAEDGVAFQAWVASRRPNPGRRKLRRPRR
jgi:hypothetical protein